MEAYPNTGSAVWADTAYRSQKNEWAQAKIGLPNIAFNFKRFIYWETRVSPARPETAGGVLQVIPSAMGR